MRFKIYFHPHLFPCFEYNTVALNGFDVPSLSYMPSEDSP